MPHDWTRINPVIKARIPPGIDRACHARAVNHKTKDDEAPNGPQKYNANTAVEVKAGSLKN